MIQALHNDIYLLDTALGEFDAAVEFRRETIKNVIVQLHNGQDAITRYSHSHFHEDATDAIDATEATDAVDAMMMDQ